MRAIILAAGQGQRLRPITDDRPKCMVEFNGETLLAHQLRTLHSSATTDITVVTGYCPETIESLDVKTVHNARYAETNMVATMLCAEDLFDGGDDVLVAYADILYERKVIQVLASTNAAVATVVDRQWQRLWSARMEDPLADAETLKLGDDNRITELGKKARAYGDIEGQYIGLTKVSRSFAQDFVSAYRTLDPNASYDGKDKENIYMTRFLQHLIDSGVCVLPAFIDGGWLEFDTLQDLHTYQILQDNGRLATLFDPSQ